MRRFKKAPIVLKYNTNEYYKAMAEFGNGIPVGDFNKIHRIWYSCFSCILKGLHKDYTDGLVQDLFYSFAMCNWKDLHLEQSQYKGFTNISLYKEFCSEALYISDRISYDRLFRTHWLFRQVFDIN